MLRQYAADASSSDVAKTVAEARSPPAFVQMTTTPVPPLQPQAERGSVPTFVKPLSLSAEAPRWTQKAGLPSPDARLFLKGNTPQCIESA